MTETQLNDYSLIQAHGKDAMTFLQGQLTCDVSLLTENNATLGAHCNAKGRIISLFRLFKQDEAYYLLMPTELIEAALENLKKYAIFSKVNLDKVSINTLHSLPFEFDRINQHKTDVAAGIPRLYPQTSGQFLPHYINLPALGGVSFTKGCYTGQEIIARMEHRGSLKQGLKSISLPFASEPGEKIIVQEQVLGTCVDTCIQSDESFQVLLIAKITP